MSALSTNFTKAKFDVRSMSTTEIKLAFGGAHFGKIEVEVTDGIVFKPSLARLADAFHLRQTADAVAFQVPVQRRTSEVGSNCLKASRRSSKGKVCFRRATINRLLLDGKHGGTGKFRARWQVCRTIDASTHRLTPARSESLITNVSPMVVQRTSHSQW
jgi:hypothetical protein